MKVIAGIVGVLDLTDVGVLVFDFTKSSCIEVVVIGSEEFTAVVETIGYGSFDVIRTGNSMVGISSELVWESSVSMEREDPLKMKKARIAATRIPPRINARLVLDNRGLG